MLKITYFENLFLNLIHINIPQITPPYHRQVYLTHRYLFRSCKIKDQRQYVKYCSLCVIMYELNLPVSGLPTAACNCEHIRRKKENLLH